MERKSSGITCLDKLTEGGFPEGCVVLYSGEPGTGKTIAAMQFIAEGLKKKEKCAYVTTEDTPERLKSQAKRFGWDLEGCAIFSVDEKDLSDPDDAVAKFMTALEGRKFHGINRVVIDSISSLETKNCTKDREFIRYFIKRLRELGATAVVTSELVCGQVGYSSDNISEFLADGLVVFNMDQLGEEMSRTLRVRKLRETGVKGGIMCIDFTKTGIKAE